MKSIFKKVAGIAVAVVLALGMFGCSNESDSPSHEHAFATAYTSDATYHWHAATCEHKTEVKDKSEHTFGEWTVTTPPTEKTEGVKERECSECGYKRTEKVAAIKHQHQIATEWTYDKDYHWHAASCGKEEHNEGKTAHIWNDGEIIKAATETDEGEQLLSCECGATSSKVIPALGHNHEIAKSYTSNETHHWYSASCGREEHNEGKVAHIFITSLKKAPTCIEKGINTETCSECGYSKDVETEVALDNHAGAAIWIKTADTHKETYNCCGTVKTAEASHTWNDGEVTTEPTTKKEGVKTYTCTVCGYTKTESIAKLPVPAGEVAKTNLIINGIEIAKTSEVVVIPAGTVATIEMTDDSAWSGYVSKDVSDSWKGVFLKNRKVKLSPFVMGQYPVTRDLYKAVMGSDPSTATSHETQGENPVNNLNWFDAIIFCNKLSALEGLEPVYSYNFNGTDETNPDKWISDTTNLGKVPTQDSSAHYSNWKDKVKIDIAKNGYRLPTEAEWEFAARGGDPTKEDWKYAFSGVNKSTNYYIYYNTGVSTMPTSYSKSDSNLATVGWYSNNSSNGTHEVGLKKANRLNIYDMSGNVEEWCNDFYNENATLNDSAYTKYGYVTDPLGAATGGGRCLRGGAWHDVYEAAGCAVSYRSSHPPYYHNYFRGFRVCRSAN